MIAPIVLRLGSIEIHGEIELPDVAGVRCVRDAVRERSRGGDVSESTIRSAIESGELRASRPCRRIVIEASELRAWLAAAAGPAHSTEVNRMKDFTPTATIRRMWDRDGNELDTRTFQPLGPVATRTHHLGTPTCQTQDVSRYQAFDRPDVWQGEPTLAQRITAWYWRNEVRLAALACVVAIALVSWALAWNV